MDVYSNAYWTEAFTVTEADLNRLAGFIREQKQAQDLSGLVKRVVRGRLRHGHDLGKAASLGPSPSSSPVRLWDPAAEWQPGDHAIVIRRAKGFIAVIGEVTDVTYEKAEFYLPDENRTIGYQRAEKGSENAHKWHTKVREIVAQKRATEGEAEWLELIILEYGERIAGLLLQALREDERFVLLDGRYFLHALAIPPDKEQLHQLAWSLLPESEPQSTAALLIRLPDVAGGNDAALFGLYLALGQSPHWFTNTQPEKRPLWRLAGPPPGTFTARYAAYDPDSYEILCLPGEEAQETAVSRLWQAGLLAAVA